MRPPLSFDSPRATSKVAFDFLLAKGLVKRSKKMDDPDWIGSVLRATWVSVAVVLTISVAVRWVLNTYFTEVGRFV